MSLSLGLSVCLVSVAEPVAPSSSASEEVDLSSQVTESVAPSSPVAQRYTVTIIDSAAKVVLAAALFPPALSQQQCPLPSSGQVTFGQHWTKSTSMCSASAQPSNTLPQGHTMEKKFF